MDKKHFSLELTSEKIALLSLNHLEKEQNVLDRTVLEELKSVVQTLRSKPEIKGLVFSSGKSSAFIAGADITLIQSFKTMEEAREGAASMQAIYSDFESLPFPKICAIHGACLGGGLELALCFDKRIATEAKGTVLGLPEIQLGLIPGAGGTQRLPRLVGIQAGLDMVLTGKRLDGKKAKRIGLVDKVVHENHLKEEALKLCKVSKQGRSPRKKSFMNFLLEGNPLGRMIVKSKARQMVMKTSKGFYPAPLAALDVVFSGISTSLAGGLKLEAEAFGKLAMTSASKSLIHLFHATTAIKKYSKFETKEALPGDLSVGSVGVVGAGFMGSGITNVCADKGIRVYLSDPSEESLIRAMKAAHKFFKSKLKRKSIKPFEMSKRLSAISSAQSPVGFQHTDIVIEAVFEDLNLKQKILANIESLGNEKLIFASNTSALPIGQIAEKAKHPENVIGMHFFSPVEKMPLLEVVVTKKTSEWARARTVTLGQAMGKQVIVVNDGPGFYTTRALAFFLHEAALLLSEGCKIELIDKALTDFGFPVGPITLIDEVGIDVGLHVLETMSASFGDRIGVPPGIKKILDKGKLGRKNKNGFYKYENDKKAGVDESVYSTVGAASSSSLSQKEICDRTVLVFLNESVRCLEEGILNQPYDGDVGAVFGLGFPPFWAGPFKYIDHLGAKAVVDDLDRLSKSYGKRFEPSPMLKKMALEGTRFF